MVLEATVVCLDNSEWMRNGDFLPTRLDAQAEAVQLICGAKTRGNPENTVSVMTLADRCEMLATLTQDLGKILTSMHDVKVGGKINILDGLQIAQLALKHRQNRHQRQRIVVFVGSPVEVDEKELVAVAKKLKKNNVAVDVVNFGEDGENEEKLEKFVSTVCSKDGNSHLVTVPAGQHVLADVLATSPILEGEGGGAGGMDEFGIDPNVDPELALALRISMEEEKARQERARLEAERERSGAAAAGGESGETATQAPPATTEMEVDAEEQAMLQQALAMSQEGAGGGFAADAGFDMMNLANMSEEEQIALAMRMSMMEGESAPAVQETGETSAENMSAVMQNPEFLNSVLGSLPGVDPEDEAIRNAMDTLRDDKTKDDSGDKKSDQ